MSQSVLKASRLALRNGNFISAVNTFNFHSRHLTAIPRFLYPAACPITPHKYRFNILQNSSYIKRTVRYCSHRRAMCEANTEIEGSVDVTKGREVLPTNVKPVHYDLTLEPDFQNFSYEGTVIIE